MSTEFLEDYCLDVECICLDCAQLCHECECECKCECECESECDLEMEEVLNILR